ncbi:DUF5011 domain-containing protein [Pumilibacter intestinalis]|uniref:DUF5011 domain-containing protein n=1 Tax=Pumilibacter intestinalis TaxID=2941511 RepID=UPI00203D47D0|nr:DUF5011 domain-containing protein [Pumilibacter intestinalis]
MSKNFKWSMAITVLLMAAVMCMAACGGNPETNGGGNLDETFTPKITVSEDTVTIPIGAEMEFPSATATDGKDGDLTSGIRVSVWLNDVIVYPAEGDGIALTDANWKPDVAGAYAVTYSVVNSANKSAKKTIKVNVLNTGMNAIAERENWITRNAAFNQDGYLAIGALSAGEAVERNPAVAYSGEKIAAGSIVSFAFNATYADGGVSPWYMAFGLTPGYVAERPTLLSDTNYPCILEIVQNKVYVRNGLRVKELGRNLLDGRDHTISAKFDVTATKVTYSLWIDSPVSSATSLVEVLYTNEFTEGAYDENLFIKENFCGWFGIMGTRNNTSDANDALLLKAFTVDAKAQIEKPVLRVDEPVSTLYINQATSFPIATAKDGTFGKDISDKVEMFILNAAGEATKIDGSYTFTESGEYTLKYYVVDDYGNIAVKTFEILCADAPTEALPTLTVDGYDDGDIIEGTAMTALTLPAVTTCEDANGKDLTSRLSVEITGPMNYQASAGGEFTPYAAGTYKVIYSVSDLTNKEKTVTLTLAVASPEENKGNQLTANPDAFIQSGTAVLQSNELRLQSGEGGFAYTGQMIYGEKVSMLLDWTIASTEDVSTIGGIWDGSYLTIINMRGGESLGNVPTSAFANEWPKGLSILIDPHDHLTVRVAGHGTTMLAKLSFENLRNAFYDKDVLLEYQVIDVCKADGSLDYCCIMLWLDGKRVGSADLPWTWAEVKDADGNLAVRSRLALSESYKNLMKAGWLKVTTYCGDKQTGRDNIVKWLSIDGKYVVRTVNVTGDDVREVSILEEYVFPEVELLFDGEPQALTRTLYIGNSAVGELIDADATKMTIGVEHMEGLRIEWSHEGIVYYTASVSVKAAVSDPVWSGTTTGIVTQTATASELPVISSVKLLGEIETSGFSYKITYANGYTVENLIGENLAAYKPVLPINYTVTAYISGQKIDEYAVTNTSGLGETDIATFAFDEGDKYKIFYTGELLWENTVTMHISHIGGFDMLYLPIRGSMERIEKTDYSVYPNGLAYRIYGGTVCIVNSKDQAMKQYGLPKSFETVGDHMVCYKVVNNADGGKIVSVTVTLWLDGVQIGSDTLLMSQIAALGGWEPSPIYGKQFDNRGFGKDTRINSMYIHDENGTLVTPVIKTDIVASKTYALDIDTDKDSVAFSIPAYTKIFGMQVKNATVKIDGVSVSGTHTFTAAGTYTLVYTLDDATVETVQVTVTKLTGAPVFAFTGADASADTVERAINSTIDIPFTCTVEGGDKSSEIAVKLHYGNYTKTLTATEYAVYKHNVRQNFTIEYLYHDTVLGVKNVIVTGLSNGNVVTDAANKTGGGANADGVWSGTEHPVYLTENLYDYTLSVKFRMTAFGYIAVGLRGIADVHPTAGYDWPANARFSFDGGSIHVYLSGNANPDISYAASDLWNENLVNTNVILTIRVADDFDANGTYLGTGVEIRINGTLVKIGYADWHMDNNTEDGYTFYVAASRSNVNWDVWNSPLNFGIFHTSCKFELEEVYFDGTIAQPTPVE